MAFLVNRYTERAYDVGSVILIKSDGQGNAGVEGLMTAIGYYNPRLNFENELVVLKSRSLTNRTIRHLDFEVSYFSEGRLKSSEVYPMNEFKVVFDRSHPQITGVEFAVETIDANTFELSTPETSGKTYYYDSIQKADRDFAPDKSSEQKYQFNQWIETDYYRFKIVAGEQMADARNYGNRYRFRFNAYENLVDRYTKGLEVEPTAEGSSAVDLKLVSTTRRRHVPF
ncbi:MAG: hypothetical protein U5L96_08965 [Owenweeksia sp.]|nr:hypothetical protein [Owenweeksia sp.]